MPLKKSKIHKILVFTLSNIGDVILTFPVLDIVRRDFPDASLDIIVGAKSKSLFDHHPHIRKVFIYERRQPFWKIFAWMGELRREDYDLFVDLRNSALPAFVAGHYRTSFILRKKAQEHMREKHLRHLSSVYPYKEESETKYFLQEDNPAIPQKPFCVMAPGSANPHKRWSAQGFAAVADALYSRHRIPTIFIGDQTDRALTEEILSHMKGPAENRCGQTSLLETAAIIRQCLLAVVNDSAPMHMASYLDRPVLALFGSASSPQRYGPWSTNSIYLFSEKITDITPEEVIRRIQLKEGSVHFG